MTTPAMFCHQCSMSAAGGCGAKGQTQGTCLKPADLSRLQDMMIFGAKGLAAYRQHARALGVETVEVDDVLAETLYFTLTNVNFSFEDHIEQLMKLGRAGTRVMNLLGDAHARAFGCPSPVVVSQDRAEGHAILVTGHDLPVLERILQATAGTGIRVYTHSEMLPAHAYPKLRRHPHLAGNVGRSWFDQSDLYERWSGTIVVTTNCIVPKKKAAYLDRVYTYGIVGADGTRTLDLEDLSGLVAHTLALPPVTGFDADATLSTGHHYASILDLAPDILAAVGSGKITRFFVVAGCDAPGKGGDYYRELVAALPASCVVLTSSCGKFRFNDLDLGVVPGTGIPRYFDLGQCNDSYGAVHIAAALGDALGVGLEDLPLSIVLSWMEQKAIIILLSLLSLGVKDIHIGPKAPEFVSEGIFQFLQEQFRLRLVTDARSDLLRILGGDARLPIRS